MDTLVCISSPVEFDEFAYTYWTEGRTVDECTKAKLEQQSNAVGSFQNFVFFSHGNKYSADMRELLKFEIRDQYLLFSQLEHYLAQPVLLMNFSATNVCPFYNPLTRDFCIEKFWGLDDVIVREIIARQRLTKTRKDLDDICENTGLNIRKVTRQFDNLKCAYNLLESIQFMGNLFDHINNNFCLKGLLLRKYTCIMFLLDSKFTLTTKKTRMQRIACDSLEMCAAAILSCLTLDVNTFFIHGRSIYDSKLATGSVVNEVTNTNININAVTGEDGEFYFGQNSVEHSMLTNDSVAWTIIWGLLGLVNTIDLDKQLLASLRDIRTVVTGEILDAGVAFVRNAVKEKSAVIARKIDASKARVILKALMQIGSCLSQTREFRDLFEDILGKVIEPLENDCGLTPAEMSTFLICCCSMARAYPESHRGQNTMSRSASISSASAAGVSGMGLASGNTSNPGIASYSVKDTSGGSQLSSSEGVRMGNPSESSRSVMAENSPRPGMNNSERSFPGGYEGSSNSTSYSMSATSSTRGVKASKVEELRSNWVRFVTCCRLCMVQLLDKSNASQYYRLNL